MNKMPSDFLLDHDEMDEQVAHCSVFVIAYSFLAEGTTNATWGGSTHGTLDDLAAEQDNDIQEHSAGYSRSVNILTVYMC
jgi:hypothetical protein